MFIYLHRPCLIQIKWHKFNFIYIIFKQRGNTELVSPFPFFHLHDFSRLNSTCPAATLKLAPFKAAKFEIKQTIHLNIYPN